MRARQILAEGECKIMSQPLALSPVTLYCPGPGPGLLFLLLCLL